MRTNWKLAGFRSDDNNFIWIPVCSWTDYPFPMFHIAWGYWIVGAYK